jgi:hypothetical protein
MMHWDDIPDLIYTQEGVDYSSEFNVIGRNEDQTYVKVMRCDLVWEKISNGGENRDKRSNSKSDGLIQALNLKNQSIRSM